MGKSKGEWAGFILVVIVAMLPHFRAMAQEKSQAYIPYITGGTQAVATPTPTATVIGKPTQTPTVTATSTPIPTATPTPFPTPTATVRPEVNILSAHGETYPEGSQVYMLFMEVQNISARPICGIGVEVTFKYSNGETQTDYTTAKRYWLPAGEKSPAIWQHVPQDVGVFVTGYTVTGLGSDPNCDNASARPITVVSANSNVAGSLKITGQMRNDNAEELLLYYHIVTFYNDDGSICWAGIGAAGDGSIAPGATAGYSVTFPDTFPGNTYPIDIRTKTYKVDGQGFVAP